MEIIAAVVLILLISIVFLLIGQRFNIPSVVSFLVLGILVGPFGLALLTDQATIEMIGQIGVILLLFVIGLEFSFEKLFKSWKVVIIGGLLQVCTTIAAIAVIVRFLGFPFNEALFIGFLVSLSSTAIVMKVLQDRGQVETLSGRTLLGILIFQDIAIIPMILITPLLIGGGGPDFETLPSEILKVALLIVIIIVSARWLVPWFLFRVALAKSRELFFFSIAGICFAVAWLTSMSGLSFTLGAFVAGLIISESEYSIDAISHIIPFRDVFAAVFFVSIGMLLNARIVMTNFTVILLLVVVILCVKILTGSLAVAALGMPARVCVFSGLALCQIGEFSFVLAESGLKGDLIPVTTYQFFLAAAIITMALTPFSMKASPGATRLLYRILPGRFGPVTNAVEQDLPENRMPHDHIIITGYGTRGRSVANAAEIAGIPYIVIELNPDIIRKERAKKLKNCIFGDATREEVLIHAGIRQAKALVISIPEHDEIARIIHHARLLSPSIYIVARAGRTESAQELLKKGADEVISEDFEASLEIFARILNKYQISEDEISKFVSRIRRKGYTLFKKSGSPDINLTEYKQKFDDQRMYTVRVMPGSWAAGKTFAELDLKNQFGIEGASLRRQNETLLEPPEDISLLEGDKIILFTTEQNIQMIADFFS
jgi:CPA2 family monovalent cation:H+ antiporter-2